MARQNTRSTVLDSVLLGDYISRYLCISNGVSALIMVAEAVSTVYIIREQFH